MSADKGKHKGQKEHWGTACIKAIARSKADHARRSAKGDHTMRPVKLPERASLETLVQIIVDACVEFNDEVLYHRGQPGTTSGDAAKRHLGGLYCKRVGLVGLRAIQKALAEIAPAIEQEDRERLARSPIKSRAAGDNIKEDPIYRVLTAAVGFFKLIKSGRPEARSFQERFKEHLDEIRRLPSAPRRDASGWGKVITEVIWHRRAEEIFHVNEGDLEPRGNLYVLLVAEATAACRRRKQRRIKRFRRQCGMNCRKFLSLDDAGRLKALESRGQTPEEKDKAAVKASRLDQDAREIEAITVNDGDLKEALRDRLVERLKRMSR